MDLNHKVEVFIKTCRLYYRYVPIKNKAEFLTYCFHQTEYPSLRKLPLVVGEGFLAAGLIDDNQVIRDLAELLMNHGL